jgi:hypothetical protein
VSIDVTGIFTELIAGNGGPDPADPDRRQTPNYGIVATLAGYVLTVELTFRNGSAYCCHEWGCHVALIGGKRWDGFRQLPAAHGIAAPLRFELRWTCVIEEGAIFFDFCKPDPIRRGWYAFGPVQARRCQGTAMEASSFGE